MTKKIALLASLMVLGLTGTAHADGGHKFWGLIWWPSHWINQDFQPYYEDAQGPHNTEWDSTKLDDKNWTPQDWIAADGGSGKKLVQKWYNADIIRDQDSSWGKPYVVVGPNFYHLGGADKRRVMATLDAVNKITNTQAGEFYLEDYRTDEVIGVYNKNSGLDLQ